MTLLNTLFNKFFNKRQPIIQETEEPGVTNEDHPLRAALLIGIDKQQQYFFDMKWDYEDVEKSSNDLANIVLGLTYGLFTTQINNLLVSHSTETNELDELIIRRVLQLINDKSDLLNNLLNNDSPIIKPSEVFRPAQDVKSN